MKLVAVVACLAAIAALASAAYVPVYVMLPLDVITIQDGYKDPSQTKQWLSDLKNAGTDGITVDVWWGVVEQQSGQYDWSSYSSLFKDIKNAGLLIQPIMDFHKCGGNVGDNCDVPLPPWVLSVGNSNEDIFYKSSSGTYTDEYISLFVDNESLFNGRTPLDIYGDFVSSFASEFSSYMGSTIKSVEIGMGPAGELRYPSYQLKYWTFCGVGEFQSYNSYAVSSLSQAASNAGQPSWGNPTNAGSWSDHINAAPFFQDNQPNGYDSSYGKFFLNWYSQSLISHGRAVLKAVQGSLKGVNIMGKVAGIHWWYKTHSHAAELTAGYYNTNQNNAYADLADLFSSFGAQFDFTALGLSDSAQPSDCSCGPQELVIQAKQACDDKNVDFGGENALPSYSSYGYGLMERDASELNTAIAFFSYLRLDSTLVQNSGNYNSFKSFVDTLHNLQLTATGSMYMSEGQDEEINDSSRPRRSAAPTVLAAMAACLIVAVGVSVFVHRRRRQAEVETPFSQLP